MLLQTGRPLKIHVENDEKRTMYLTGFADAVDDCDALNVPKRIYYQLQRQSLVEESQTTYHARGRELQNYNMFVLMLWGWKSVTRLILFAR